MDDGWIEFQEGPQETFNRFYVSINTLGELIFNRHVDAELEHPEALVLFFNPDTDKIALKPAGRLTPNAFPIKLKGDYGNRRIRVKPFMNKYEMNFDSTVRFLAPEITDGVLILDLRNLNKTKRIPLAARRGR